MFFSDFFWRIVPFCRSTKFTDLALGPPTSSVPGVATPLASVNPKAFKARETCGWSGSYSIPHCRNVSVLPKKLTVRDCDDSGPRVTTLLNSHAPRKKLSTCFRLSRRHTKKNITLHQNVCLQAFLEEVARRSHASGKSSRLQNLSIVFSPTLGQHPKNRTSSFAISHTCLAALPWGLRLAIGRRRRELRLSRSGHDSRQRW